MNEREIKVFASIEDLNEFAANEFVRLSREAIIERRQFTVALSGGSTPKKLNALLASEKFRSQIEWEKIQFFFGDERLVAPDDEESNYRMANETLFSKINISSKNIHRFETEEVIEFDKKRSVGKSLKKSFVQKSEMDFNRRVLINRIVGVMNEEIRDSFNLKVDILDPQENEFPRFDLIFLGMGADGHTASLFPETSALTPGNNFQISVANFVPKFKTYRLTFTFKTINNARNIIFLVAGEDKAEALHEVLEGDYNPEKFPSQEIKPKDGKLIFLIDEKAAANLKSQNL